MRCIRTSLAGLAAMLLLGFAAASAQQPVKIRISWVAPVVEWPSLLLHKKELAKHMGKSYVLESTRYAGTPLMITALASGELDIANFAYSSLGIAIRNSGMDDLKVIAGEFQDGASGYYTDEYLVLADSPIQKIADLKGKVIGTNAVGSAVDVVTRAVLRKAGLEDKRDYTMIEAPFGAMRAMLAEKKVDLIPAILPFALDPELKKISRPLFNQHDTIGVTQMTVWAAHRPFLDKNRAAMVDLMEDTLTIIRWFMDPANHKEAAEIAARVTKQPAERFGWLFTKADYYRDPGLMPDVEALQKNVDMTVDLGFVKGKLDVSKHTDLSIVKEAAARLK